MGHPDEISMFSANKGEIGLSVFEILNCYVMSRYHPDYGLSAKNKGKGRQPGTSNL